MEKVALFVDWDNLRQEIAKVKKKQRKLSSPLLNFDYNNSEHISQLFNKYLSDKEKFYRIFFYTAKPLTDDEIQLKLRRKADQEAFEEYLEGREPNKIYNLATNFLNDIVKENFIALRTGKMQVRGIKDGGSPDIVQKQVDMLIGLDISEVSYNKHADKIIVFSKDTDMIPALKTARINGLTVVLANFEESNNISQELITHTDLVRNISLVSLNSEVSS